MIVLLLLGAFVGLGLSEYNYHEVYGNTRYIRLPRKPNSIEFSPKYSSNVTILWKWGDPLTSVDRKGKYTGIFYEMHNLTQRDTGHYVVRDKDQRELSTYTMEVKAKTKIFEKTPGEHLSFTFNLEPNSCNIYFFPESNSQRRVLRTEIVHKGKLQGCLDECDCVGFVLIKPCGISNKALQMSCKGRFEIRDENDDTALEVSLEMEPIVRTFERKSGEHLSLTFDLKPSSCNIYFFPESYHEPGELRITIVSQGKLQRGSDEFDCDGFDLIKPCGISNQALKVSCQGRFEFKDQDGDTVLEMLLEMESPPFEPSSISISVGVFLASLFCCCVRHCCCRKSSSKKETPETEAADSDVHYEEYNLEPVRLQPDQVREPYGTNYPARPSYTLTDPLIHSHPIVDLPPAYSEVSAPAGQTDAPTFPVHSDPEPRFDLKGMSFPSAPPLSSDSTICDVYTSGKLNFL